jgi:hypothetical protein
MKYVIATLFFLFGIHQATAMVSCAAGAYYSGCVRHPPVAVHGAVVAHPYHGTVYHRPGGATVYRR